MLDALRERRPRRPGTPERQPATEAPPEASGGTPPDAGSGARGDAFVSYARRDEPFVRNVLVAALVERGKNVWLDVKDIPPAADWRERIRAGIEAARAFVFVVSSDSAASGPCRDELQQAGDLNKPLIVVIREDVPRDRLPPALERVEWIFLRETDPLDEGLEEVVAALETDLEWRDQHNELAVRARQWEREGHDPALQLRGRALADADEWQADAGPHRESPTAGQIAYIQAGRRAAGRRTRILVGSVTTALVVSLALAVYAFVQRGQAVSRERTATSLALAAAANRERGANLGASLLLGLEATHARATPDARSSMIGALERAARARLDAILCCHKGALDSVALSPDGKTAAAGADDGTVLIWDLEARRLLARIEGAHGSAVTSLAFSPNGAELASASADRIALWDATTGDSLGHLGGSKGTGADAIAFGPDGHTLAAGRGGLTLWDTRRPDTPGPSVVGPFATTHAVAFSPDGRRVAFDSQTDGKYGGSGLMLADPSDGKILPGSAVGSVTAVAVPNAGVVAAVYPDGSTNVRAGRSAKALATGHAVSSAAFASGGRLLAVATSKGLTEVWDTRTRRRVAELRGHSGDVESVALAPNGTVAAAGDDGTVMLWRLGKQEPFGRPLTTRTGLTDTGYDPQTGIDRPDAFAFDRDGGRIAVVDGGHVVVVSTGTGHPTRRVPATATGLAFGPADDTLVLAGARSGIRSVDGKLLERLPNGGVNASVGADGTVATGGYVASVAVRRPGGEPQVVPKTQGVSCPVLSPDGRTLAAARGATLLLWDTSHLAQPRTTFPAGAEVDCLAFSPDGRMLATAGWDGTVRLWNARTGEQLGGPLFRYAGPATKLSVEIETSVINDLGPVAGVAFSPDGTMLVSAHGDGTVRLWDVGSRGQLGRTITGPDGALESVGFSPDGRMLATSAVNGVVRLWRGFLWRDFGGLRDQVCALVVGGLTRSDWDRYVPGLAYRASCGE
jgi:WD40 repeat protein